MAGADTSPDSGGAFQTLQALAAGTALALVWGGGIALLVLPVVAFTIGRGAAPGVVGHWVTIIAGFLWLVSMAWALRNALTKADPEPAASAALPEEMWSRQRDAAGSPTWILDLAFLPATMSVAAFLVVVRGPEPSPVVVRRRPPLAEELGKSALSVAKKRPPRNAGAT